VIKEKNTTRPLIWEDSPLAEPRFRGARQTVLPNGSVLPGVAPETEPAEDDELPRPEFKGRGLKGQGVKGGSRRDWQNSPWWRPASTAGRVFLALGALVVAGGLVTAGMVLKTYISRDARFRIAGAANIQATGLTEVSRAEMLPVFGEDIGRGIFFVPLSERRMELEQLPWVERATVMRLLPDQIRVTVVERKPVAFVRRGQQVGLVDASGVLLSMSAAAMAQHHYSFPVVTGIDPKDPLPSRKARMAVYQRLLGELDAGGQKVSEQLSEIDLTDPEDARVLMPEQGADILAHFGQEHFLERYERYKAHIAEWRQQYPKLAAVDLRYEHQAVLEMAHGSEAVDGAVGDPAAAGVKPGDASLKPEDGAGKPAEKPAPGKAAAKAEVAKAETTAKKPAKSQTAKAKTPNTKAAKDKAAKEKAAKAKAAAAKKKRAEAERAALNVDRKQGRTQKSAPAIRPAANPAEGQ
jgi:cell division protein FtsQ